MAQSVVMNSLISGEGEAGEQSVIEHSRLEGAWRIGHTSFVSQIHSFTDLEVKNEVAVQEIAVNEDDLILISYGVRDQIKVLITIRIKSRLNMEQKKQPFVDRVGIDSLKWLVLSLERYPIHGYSENRSGLIQMVSVRCGMLSFSLFFMPQMILISLCGCRI